MSRPPSIRCSDGNLIEALFSWNSSWVFYEISLLFGNKLSAVSRKLRKLLEKSVRGKHHRQLFRVWNPGDGGGGGQHRCRQCKFPPVRWNRRSVSMRKSAELVKLTSLKCSFISPRNSSEICLCKLIFLPFQFACFFTKSPLNHLQSHFLGLG